jgi:hypothetical protein
MQLPEKELRLYLEKNIDYSLDEENLQGLLSFFQHSADLGLIPRLNPISIAGRADLLGIGALAPTVSRTLGRL